MSFIWIVLGILSALYGAFVAGAGSGTHFYMIWFFLAAVLFAAAVLQSKRVSKKLPACLKKTLNCLLAAGLVLLLICEGFVLSGFHRRGEPGLDCVIVLGAQVTSWGPGVALLYRLETAADYLKENPGTVCVCSGGQGYNEPDTEAAIMKQWLVGQGIEAERILEEGLSRDTSENIRNSIELLEEKISGFSAETSGVGIITNDFHVFRGTRIARSMGLGSACGIAAPSNPYYLPQNMLREFFGVLKDLLAGNLT